MRSVTKSFDENEKHKDELQYINIQSIFYILYRIIIGSIYKMPPERYNYMFTNDCPSLKTFPKFIPK